MQQRIREHGIVWTLILLALGCGSTPPVDPASDTQQTAKNEPSKSSAQLTLTPADVDLGKLILRQPPVESVVVVRNNTSEPIRLAEPIPDCRCSEAKLDKEELAPEEETKLTIIVSAKSPGEQNASVTLMSESGSYLAKCRLRWHAGTKLLITPDRLNLGSVFEGHSEKREIGVTGNEGILEVAWAPSLITSVDAFPPEEIKIERLDDGQLIRLVVTLTPTVGGSTTQGAIVIHGVPPIGDIPIPIDWDRRQQISLEPRAVFLGLVEPRAEWSAKVVVRSVDLTLTGASVAEEKHTANVESINPNTLIITLKGVAPQLDGAFASEVALTLMTSEGVRQVVVAVTGIAKGAPGI